MAVLLRPGSTQSLPSSPEPTPLRLLPRVLKFLRRVRAGDKKKVSLTLKKPPLKRLARRLSDLTTGVSTRSGRTGSAGSGARSCLLFRVVRISRAAFFPPECVRARARPRGPVIKQAERLLKTAG